MEILRDRFGVPHVRARTAYDVTFALGFCHGQDRLWQLEFFRRATAGRLSEFAGDDSLPADRLMRTLGMRRAAEREDRDLSPHAARFATAYVTGINAAIDSARALPIEFQLLRLEPEPWNTVDLLAAAKLMGFGLSTNWEMELHARPAGARGRGRARGGSSRSTRAANPIVVGAGRGIRGTGTDLAEQIERVREALGLRHTRGRRFQQLGRSGERSVTGKPLLACRDPTLTHHGPGPLVRGGPSPATTTACGARPCRRTLPGIRADGPRRIGLHERDGRHAGPVRRADERRRRRGLYEFGGGGGGPRSCARRSRSRAARSPRRST